jgi:hypothetical protein
MLFGWFKKKPTQEQTPAAMMSPAPSPTHAPVPASSQAAPTNNTVPVQTEKSAAPAAIDIPRDKIGARAYEIWVRKGKPHGKDFENWVEAEAELRAEFAANSKAEPLPRKPR